MSNQSTAPFEAAYRAFMVPLFVGVADALICLIFNVTFRSGRPYFSSDLINVSYIIFGLLFLFAMIGIIYLLLLKFSTRGNIIFVFLFAVLSILAIAAVTTGHFSDNPIENASFRGLLLGITIIVGVSATVGVPLLYGSRKFEQNVV